MKIETTDNLNRPAPGGVKKAGGNQGVRFQDFLQTAVAGTSAGQSAKALHNPLPSAVVRSAASITDKKEAVGRADHLLNLLESYQNELAEHEGATQDSLRFIRAIEDRADELVPYLESLSDDDAFRDYLNRLVITVSVEAIKYRRGDFL
jgi:hypothetical protein